MPLISSKQNYSSSAEYQKISLSIDKQFGYRAETDLFLQRRPLFLFLIPDNIRGTNIEIENSLFLKSERDIEQLEGIYTFDKSKDIKRFLWTHKDVIETLFNAYKEIKRVFSLNIIDIGLEYDKDPDEDFEGLSIIIKTTLNPELSLTLLDKFDEEWWLDVDDKIRTVLTVMVRSV